MSNSEAFNVLVERAMTAGNRTHMRPVIEKELLHYDILFALDKEGLLDSLTFQGGTCLRLCYGAVRFSEDLDFVGGYDFAAAQLFNIKSCIEHYIGERYTLDVTVKEPRELIEEPEYRHIKVNKWQIRIVTSPGRPDLPKQMIKIEVANVPAYSRQPQSLKSNYDFLPDGYGDTLVIAESLDEILADKLVSLPDCTSYVRHRDIWDLRWLKQQGATMDSAMIRAKATDYRSENYQGKVDDMIARLPDIIHGKDFRNQLSRFIPIDVQERTLRKEKFLRFLQNEITQMLTEARDSFVGS
jgi:predicted nucleotidyltransferase component of viral defense system